MSAALTRITPEFSVGDRVVIRNCAALGHCRTPWYVRGKSGTIVEIHGAFRDPERLAYHRPGFPERVLYKVRLRQHDLWAEYQGGKDDNLDVDIYEPWLGAAAAAAKTGRKGR